MSISFRQRPRSWPWASSWWSTSRCGRWRWGWRGWEGDEHHQGGRQQVLDPHQQPEHHHHQGARVRRGDRAREGARWVPGQHQDMGHWCVQDSWVLQQSSSHCRHLQSLPRQRSSVIIQNSRIQSCCFTAHSRRSLFEGDVKSNLSNVIFTFFVCIFICLLVCQPSPTQWFPVSQLQS